MCAASNLVVETAGKRSLRMPARLSANSLRMSEAPASSARMARRPVPADGSRTTSAGVIAAATLATYASPIGVENCWRDFAFLGPPCLCRKEARNPQQHRQHGGRRRRLGAHGGAIPSQEQDGRRLAGVIGRLPVPGAGRVRSAKRCLHRVAQNSGVDAPTPFEIGQKLARSLNDGRSDNCGGTDRERHGGAVDERFGHGRDFSESGTGPSRPALS